MAKSRTPTLLLKKIALSDGPLRVVLVDWADIYYIEAEGHDTRVRIASRRRLRHAEPLEVVERRLPSPPFFRTHRTYLVNLDRVKELRARSEHDWELRLDPPVNRVLPIARNRLRALRRLLDR